MPIPETCLMCGKPVRMMCAKGTGFCCENCKDTAQRLGVGVYHPLLGVAYV